MNFASSLRPEVVLFSIILIIVLVIAIKYFTTTKRENGNEHQNPPRPREPQKPNNTQPRYEPPTSPVNLYQQRQSQNTFQQPRHQQIPPQQIHVQQSPQSYQSQDSHPATVSSPTISIELPALQNTATPDIFVIKVKFEPESHRIYQVGFGDNAGRIEYSYTSSGENILKRSPFELKKGVQSGLMVVNPDINPNVMLPECQKYLSDKGMILAQSEAILRAKINSPTLLQATSSTSLIVVQVVFDYNNILGLQFYDLNAQWHYATDPNDNTNHILFLPRYKMCYTLNTTTKKLELQVVNLETGFADNASNKYLNWQQDLSRRASRLVHAYEKNEQGFQTLS